MSAQITSFDDKVRRAHEVLERVCDPEIPVLSIVDLGIVRSVSADGAGVEVGLTPTYTGCPATEVIEASVIASLAAAGLGPVRVRRLLSPPWTTDWISEAGRTKLAAYGIVPPATGAASKAELLHGSRTVACPRCGTEQTEKISEFGSTPCKAAYRCLACLEPFDYFKCL